MKNEKSFFIIFGGKNKRQQKQIEETGFYRL